MTAVGRHVAASEAVPVQLANNKKVEDRKVASKHCVDADDVDNEVFLPSETQSQQLLSSLQHKIKERQQQQLKAQPSELGQSDAKLPVEKQPKEGQSREKQLDKEQSAEEKTKDKQPNENHPVRKELAKKQLKQKQPEDKQPKEKQLKQKQHEEKRIIEKQPEEKQL